MNQWDDKLAEYAAYKAALLNEFRPAHNAEIYNLWIEGHSIEMARKILQRRGRMQMKRRKSYMSLEKAHRVLALALRDVSTRIMRHRIDPETADLARMLRERADKVLRIGEPLD